MLFSVALAMMQLAHTALQDQDLRARVRLRVQVRGRGRGRLRAKSLGRGRLMAKRRGRGVGLAWRGDIRKHLYSYVIILRLRAEALKAASQHTSMPSC